MTPTVSICIPAYREPDLLRKLLNSIIIQTFEDYEIIITDDSVNDIVHNVVKDFEKDGRIKYFKNRKTKGSPENWNEVLRHASGKYVKIMHHDDWFSSQSSLQEFVRIMEENPDIILSFCATDVIGEDGFLKFTYSPSQKDLKKLARDPNCLFNKVTIGAPSVTIFKNNLGIFFDANLKWVVDIDFYIRVLSANNKFVFCPKPLLCVSSEALNRVTKECLENREINLFEYFYLYQKIETKKLSDLKYLKFIAHKLFAFNVHSKDDLIKLGIKEPLSLTIRAAVIISASLLRNKKPIMMLRNLLRAM
jgi:glycosyltransferase involved in cell wall biosynthesis